MSATERSLHQHESPASIISPTLVARRATDDAVSSFERGFAHAHGVPMARAVGRGSAPLALALHALGVRRGAEVVVAALAPAATVAAVAAVGAHVVRADVDGDTLLLTQETVAAVRTPRTRAVVATHLFGHLVGPADLLAWARDGLLVVEDATHAHLARRDGVGVGQAGHAAAFSAAIGCDPSIDAGGVVTFTDAAPAKVVARSSRDPRAVRFAGARFDPADAARLDIALEDLGSWTQARRSLAFRFRERLDGSGVPLVPWHDGDAHHAVAVRLAPDVRERAEGDLRRAGVAIDDGAGLGRGNAVARRARTSYPIASSAAEELLVLPLTAALTFDDVDAVCAMLIAAAAAAAGADCGRRRRPGPVAVRRATSRPAAARTAAATTGVAAAAVTGPVVGTTIADADPSWAIGPEDEDRRGGRTARLLAVVVPTGAGVVARTTRLAAPVLAVGAVIAAMLVQGGGASTSGAGDATPVAAAGPSAASRWRDAARPDLLATPATSASVPTTSATVPAANASPPTVPAVAAVVQPAAPPSSVVVAGAPMVAAPATSGPTPRVAAPTRAPRSTSGPAITSPPAPAVTSPPAPVGTAPAPVVTSPPAPVVTPAAPVVTSPPAPVVTAPVTTAPGPVLTLPPVTLPPIVAPTVPTTPPPGPATGPGRGNGRDDGDRGGGRGGGGRGGGDDG